MRCWVACYRPDFDTDSLSIIIGQIYIFTMLELQTNNQSHFSSKQFRYFLALWGWFFKLWTFLWSRNMIIIELNWHNTTSYLFNSMTKKSSEIVIKIYFFCFHSLMRLAALLHKPIEYRICVRFIYHVKRPCCRLRRLFTHTFTHIHTSTHTHV